MPPLRTYVQLPPLAPRGIINPQRGPFSVVIPEATTNLLTNPSFETGTTSWIARGSASIAQSTTQQYKGAASLAITPTSGSIDGAAYSGTLSLTAGTTYTASAWVLGQAGRSYTFAITTSADVVLVVTTFTATGYWQRVSATFTETSTATRRIALRKDTHTSTTVLYLDAVQVEAKSYPTTYCDGDQLGLIPNQNPVPYLWNGVAHASTSSRSAQTRAGGKVANLDEYGVYVTGYTGLGMEPVHDIVLPYSQADGAAYIDTLHDSREFAIIGRIQATSDSLLQRLRADLSGAISRDRVAIHQPMVVKYQMYDCLNPVGAECDLICSYTGGLEGNAISATGEDVSITLAMYQPNISMGDAGKALGALSSLSGIYYLVRRNAQGTWEKLAGGDINSNILDMAYNPVDGNIYIVGAFSTINGVTIQGVAKWNGTTWSAVGSGTAYVAGTMQGVAVAPNGNVWIVGSFTTGGGSATSYIGVWDGATWSQPSTAPNAVVDDVVFDAIGNAYVTGNFTNIATRIAKYDGAAWSALSTGLSGEGGTLSVIPGTTQLYVSGLFATAGGVTVNNVARWDGTTFVALGSGTNAVIDRHALDTDGSLYIGGDFTTAGGVTVNYAARWNGSAWESLAGGFVATATYVNSVRIPSPGQIYFAGSNLTSAGGRTLINYITRWNGSVFLPLDIIFSGTNAMSAPWVTGTPELYVSGNLNNVSATTTTPTTVTNPDNAAVYPQIIFGGLASGTASLYVLNNETTDAHIFFSITLFANERLTLDLRPERFALTSNILGDRTSGVLSGSDIGRFQLIAGDNTISFLASSSTVTATVQWTRQLESIDESIY